MNTIYEYLLSKKNNKASFFYSEIVQQIYDLVKKPNDYPFDKLDKICKEYPNVEKILDVVLTLAHDNKYDVKNEMELSDEPACIVYTPMQTHVAIFITIGKKAINLQFFNDYMMFVYMNNRDFYKCSANGKKLILITKHPYMQGSSFKYMTTSEETFNNIKNTIIDLLKN